MEWDRDKVIHGMAPPLRERSQIVIGLERPLPTQSGHSMDSIKP